MRKVYMCDRDNNDSMWFINDQCNFALITILRKRLKTLDPQNMNRVLATCIEINAMERRKF